MSEDSGRKEIADLVSKYERNRDEYLDPEYQEAELRSDFLDPFFEALGWDINNEAGHPPALREVKPEARVKSGQGGTKKPDYEFRGKNADAEFFLEAKKPSVSMDSEGPAIQTRQYGWTKGLRISVLSNFERLVIYDCTVQPDEEDDARVARLRTYKYSEYVDKFDEIQETLSRDAVYDNSIETEFSDLKDAAERVTFDELFLEQLEDWREILAESIVKNNSSINENELNYFVHKLLNRIIFLRIAEDRELETHEQLKNLDEYTYESLWNLFCNADDKYNSGLFNLIDQYSAEEIDIEAEAIGSVLEELYYPESPYTFAVVESDIIGQVYDLFLGKELKISGGDLSVEEKPEVLHSQGAVTTPDYIIKPIVKEAVQKQIQNKTPSDLSDFSVGDICCGSGVFLTSTFEVLIEHYRSWYAENEPDTPALIEIGDEKQLAYWKRREILEDHLYAVDIDALATEVTRFNLMLKLLEDQSTNVIEQYKQSRGYPLVPDLSDNIKQGNSLVDNEYYKEYDSENEETYKVDPFDFSGEFSHIMDKGGFDALIGNPPYIRIQKMREYTPDSELEFYDDENRYHTAKSHNYDKYSLFVERALKLTHDKGEIGYIVSQKFLTNQVGQNLRKVISDRNALNKLIHFGVDQVFKNHMTYTCLLFLKPGGTDKYHVEKDFDLSDWKENQYDPKIVEGENSELSSDPWTFASDAVNELFNHVREKNPYRLDDLTDVFVGLQTSRNKAYFLKDYEHKNGYYLFTDYKDNKQKVEEEIVKPHLHTTNKKKPTVYPISKIRSNRKIIYPYEDEEVIPPKELEQKYPEAWKYFTTPEIKEDLESRSMSSSKVKGSFYRYGRKQGLASLKEEKITMQVVSLEPRYGLDSSGIKNTGGGDGGPFYNVKKTDTLQRKTEHDKNIKIDLDLRYILGVLHHPLIEAMVRDRSSFFRGGYYSHYGQYIEHLPIKVIDETDSEEVDLYESIIKDVQKHLDLFEKYDNTSVPSRKNKIESQMTALRDNIQEKVSSLYDLSDKEVTIAEEV